MKHRFKAIIFDMDGVLVDSEHWWQMWERKFFITLLGSWTTEQQQDIIGKSLADIVTALQTKHSNLTITKEKFFEEYNHAAKEIYQKQSNLMPNVIDVLHALTKRGLMIGLASSSHHAWINYVLSRFDLQKYFHAIVSSDDVGARGKPAPDIYLHTAQKINVDPKYTIVVEDACHGITAAKAAGMFTVAYQTPYNHKQNLTNADMHITDLLQVLYIFNQQHP